MTAARQLSYGGAIREALDLCLAADPRVYVMGLGVPDPVGIFGTTRGLAERHGAERVRDMPISENAMTGVAIGTALTGMRPVMTHMRLEFAMLAIDQIVNQAAKWHYMFGGQATVPLVVRLIVGRGWGQGPQHSQSLHAWFAHVPGLKVAMPATPHDAKGLLIAAVEDDAPVLFIEHRWLHGITGPVPEGPYRVPLGRSAVLRPGRDVTVVAASYMTLEARKAADRLAAEGIEAEIVDLRTLNPLDDRPVLDSVAKTGRLVVCDHASRHAGFAGEIVARVCERRWGALKSPPERVTLPDLPAPTSRALANYYYPGPEHIAAAVRTTLGLCGADPWDGIAPEDRRDVPDPSFTGPF
ncbi:MAG: transketolase C-terminal domain-containing protein [Alphaproteobacteria bacterium]